MTVSWGSRARILLLTATDETNGRGKRGLAAIVDRGRAAFIREGEAHARAIPLVTGERGTWSPGGFIDVDEDLLPGVYELGLPDELTAEGSPTALLAVRFPGAIIEPVFINLVAYDPLDPVRLGMSALSPEARVAALRGAFPRLADEEIRERQALEERD